MQVQMLPVAWVLPGTAMARLLAKVTTEQVTRIRIWKLRIQFWIKVMHISHFSKPVCLASNRLVAQISAAYMRGKPLLIDHLHVWCFHKQRYWLDCISCSSTLQCIAIHIGLGIQKRHTNGLHKLKKRLRARLILHYKPVKKNCVELFAIEESGKCPGELKPSPGLQVIAVEWCWSA